MTLRFQPTSQMTNSHSPADLRQRHGIRFWRVLVVTALISATRSATGPVDLIAQRTENEARTIVGSLASAVFNLGWPTAEYDTLTFGPLNRVEKGYDVTVVLYGTSAFGEGRLRMELVLALRDGLVADIRVATHNATIAPPFQTISNIRILYSQLTKPLRDQRNAELLVGTWQDENSIYTYSADRRILRGPDADGTWTVQNGMLSRKYADGNEAHFILEDVNETEYRARGPRGVVWTARRIDLTSVDSARLAATYERSGIALLALAEVDSALRYFGASELVRNPERLSEIERLLQSSPLSKTYSSAAQRHAYEQQARSMLTTILPSEALDSISSASVEEIEDALGMMLPPRQVNVVVTSTPPGLAVRYRVTRPNPRYRHGPYSLITTNATVLHQRARFQFCFLDSAGRSRMTEVSCPTGCTVHLPIPWAWTKPCGDR